MHKLEHLIDLRPALESVRLLPLLKLDMQSWGGGSKQQVPLSVGQGALTLTSVKQKAPVHKVLALKSPAFLQNYSQLYQVTSNFSL